MELVRFANIRRSGAARAGITALSTTLMLVFMLDHLIAKARRGFVLRHFALGRHGELVMEHRLGQGLVRLVTMLLKVIRIVAAVKKLAHLIDHFTEVMLRYRDVLDTFDLR